MVAKKNNSDVTQASAWKFAAMSASQPQNMQEEQSKTKTKSDCWMRCCFETPFVSFIMFVVCCVSFFVVSICGSFCACSFVIVYF